MNFKPMLSATLEDPLRLTWPLLVSPKLDGIRCIIQNGVAVSRNLKPFRNAYVQETLRGLPHGIDGELIVGAPNEGHVLGRTYSGVMSADGRPDFTFHVFDNAATPLEPFYVRWQLLHNLTHPAVSVVPHVNMNSVAEFLEYERDVLADGYEGVMLRGRFGRYKHGRASHNEQLLWKWKRFTDGEAVVEAIEEGEHNVNVPTLDALGYAVRSKHQDGMKPNGQVGTIMGRDCVSNTIIPISPGRMSQDMRRHYWHNQKELIGKIVKYKSFDYGLKEASRFVTFQSFRDASDMS
jgi:DNA ligase-1